MYDKDNLIWTKG